MKNSDTSFLKGVEIKTAAGELVWFHELIGSKIHTACLWYKPWVKYWYVEFKLFNLFSLPTNFTDGSMCITTGRLSTKEEAKRYRSAGVNHIKKLIQASKL